MSSLVAQAMLKSKKTTAKPAGSRAGEPSLAAKAIQKAKDSDSKNSTGRGAQRVTVEDGDQSQPRPKRRVDRRKDTPFPALRNAPSADEDDEVNSPDEDRQFYSPDRSKQEHETLVKNLRADLEKPDSGSKKLRSRSKSAEPNKGTSKVGTPPKNAAEVMGLGVVDAAQRNAGTSFKGIVFRLACALACGILFYVVQKQVNRDLELPASVHASTLALPGNKVQLALDSKPSAEREFAELNSFRHQLKASVVNYDEEMTTEKLWQAYLDAKERNGRLAIGGGLLFGFIIAGVLM